MNNYVKGINYLSKIKNQFIKMLKEKKLDLFSTKLKDNSPKIYLKKVINYFGSI